MSSPCRGASLVLLALAALALAACQRETRHIKSKPETGADQVSLSDLYPGEVPTAAADPHAKEYEGNAYHIAQGQRYFRWFNCNGCHANGGGGMGPALMDEDWRYGGDIQHIYATIVQGRPNGMPSFRDKIPETQVWEIAAYVRSLSGNVDRLAAPSRSERMQSIPPINNINAQPPRGTDPSAVLGTAR
jgi:cytochrome c oxidase cbb3-type subunit III